VASLQAQITRLEGELAQARRLAQENAAKLEVAAANRVASAEAGHQEAIRKLEREHVEIRRQAVKQLEEEHALSRRRLAEKAGEAEAQALREHAQEVHRRQEAADARMRSLETNHELASESLRLQCARELETIQAAHQKQVEEERARHQVTAGALGHELQQATGIAKKWCLAHDDLAEALHQLLVVLEVMCC